MISTRGRYSIRILLDLAKHSGGNYIPMKDVAKRQDISLKYIEKIMPLLREGGLLDSSHGIGGGYRLAKAPENITLWEILTLAEGDMFRRALAKKKPEVLIAKKAEFMQRASEKGIVSEKQADEIFEILIPFDGYSFNKSHAVAYTMVAYWEMYIKVHYLREYKKVIKKFNEDYSED